MFIFTSLVAQTVKHLPAIQKTRVWSLGWEDPLEKEKIKQVSQTLNNCWIWVGLLDQKNILSHYKI